VASVGNNNGSKVDEVFQMAVDAVNRGEIGKGKAALAWVLDQDPNFAAAWLWLACCLQDDEAKQNCYRRASAITSSG
jgi:Tfp pilus assembly protein PilF